MVQPGAQKKIFSVGEHLIREGEVSRTLYVLMEGKLSISRGGKVIGRLAEYGELVGELGALTGYPRTASVSSESESTVLVIENAGVKTLEKLPAILQKINVEVSRKYEIISQKAAMYKKLTAVIKRQILQETIWESKRREPPKNIQEESDARQERVRIRRTIDDRLALGTDPDDDQMLFRIASEIGIEDTFRDHLSEYPWLEESLSRKFVKIEDEWSLLDVNHNAAHVIQKAEVAVLASDLLIQYEQMPGIHREMDVLRMESIIPMDTKVNALKGVFMQAHKTEAAVERQRIYLERQFSLAIQAVKADAGTDTSMVIYAARALGVSQGYEEHIRNLVSMSEVGTYSADSGI
ncbi:MAG: cyclic nucleotide-binding domain-containing protein [Candidatus Lindowbacteria bacterium]|nr:cyclic nucleotide-binding domain-containing protein [Candidatus Lindowbacteria bacterium]